MSTYNQYNITTPRTGNQRQVRGRSTSLLVDVNAGLSLLVSVSVFLRVRVRLVRGVAGLYRTGPPLALVAQVLLSVSVAGLL